MTESKRNVELEDLMPDTQALVAWLALLAVTVFVYWGSICHLVHIWAGNDDYQHGFFVLPFAVFLLWHRREMIVPFSDRGSWWGLGFLAIWLAMRLVTVYFNYGSLPELSIIPFAIGVALFAGGWQALRWAWPSIFFLVFMIPLPGFAQGLLSQKLQGIAAQMSGFVIQTVGIPAMVEGHRVVIKGAAEPLDVATACSGLRMMMLFFALSVGVALFIKRPLWERLLIVASALPIAVISNVTRISMTGILGEAARRCMADPSHTCHVIHDWAGYLMMPLGLALLWAELRLLSALLIEPLEERPLVIGGSVPDARRAAPASGPWPSAAQASWPAARWRPARRTGEPGAANARRGANVLCGLGGSVDRRNAGCGQRQPWFRLNERMTVTENPNPLLLNDRPDLRPCGAVASQRRRQRRRLGRRRAMGQAQTSRASRT